MSMKVVCCDCHKENKRMHIEAFHHDLRERRRMSMETICGDCHKEDKWLQKKKDNEPTKFKTNLEQLKHIANNAHFRNKSLVLHIYWGKETKVRANLLVLTMECDVDTWGQRRCCKHKNKNLYGEHGRLQKCVHSYIKDHWCVSDD
jgi:hypothetical protein